MVWREAEEEFAFHRETLEKEVKGFHHHVCCTNVQKILTKEEK